MSQTDYLLSGASPTHISELKSDHDSVRAQKEGMEHIRDSKAFRTSTDLVLC